ncbi:hypothetical protein GCM10027347_12630 [Larkinella harenae]
MEKIYLSRRYLRKPFRAIPILLVVLIGIEVVSWLANYDQKWAAMRSYNGIISYVFVFIRTGILPEIVTLLLLTTLLNVSHPLFRIKEIDNSFLAILRYELRFLPVILVSFLFFYPFTQTLRYLLVHFPDYAFEVYWEEYMLGTYSWRLYALYLIPTFLIGYGILTVSLFSDLLKNRRELHVQ